MKNSIFIVSILTLLFFNVSAQTSNVNNQTTNPKNQIYNSFVGCQPDTSIYAILGESSYKDIPSLPPLESRTTHQRPPFDEYKMAHWVHGLGGNETSWSAAANAFAGIITQNVVPTYKIKSHSSINYEILQALTLEDAAAQVGQSMRQEALIELGPEYDKSSSIAIGHSQGGLINRTLDKQQSTLPAVPITFGGLVTVCSPNQGAQILNNREMVTDFLSEFAGDMTAGPLGEVSKSFKDKLVGALPQWLKGVFKIPELATPAEVSKALSEFLIQDVGQFYLDTEFPNITNDYQVGADHLNQLNNYSPNNTSILAIASERPIVSQMDGIEITDEEGETVTQDNFPVPIAWETIHFFMNPAHGYDLFEADLFAHETAVEMANTRLSYIAKIADYATKAFNKGKKVRGLEESYRLGLCHYIPNPSCALLRTRLANARRDRDELKELTVAYQLGINALEDFNLNYLTALGLRVLDQTAETNRYCVCIDQDGLETRNGPLEPLTLCPTSTPLMMCYLEDVTEITNHWTILPSDGVLSVETQMNIPQANELPVVISENNGRKWNWDNYRDIRTPQGSTHMAIRNDDKGRQMLISLFEGEFGDFFQTDRQ